MKINKPLLKKILADSKIQLHAFAAVLQLTGFLFIGFKISWLLVGCIFIILWGNNIQQMLNNKNK